MCEVEVAQTAEEVCDWNCENSDAKRADNVEKVCRENHKQFDDFKLRFGISRKRKKEELKTFFILFSRIFMKS